MSNHEAPERRPLDAAMKGLLIFLGALLLLPGLCSIFFMVAFGGDGWNSALGGLWIVCLAISAGGVLLIRSAARR